MQEARGLCYQRPLRPPPSARRAILKTLLIIALSVFAAIGLALGVCYVAGSRMPREHRSFVAATLPASRAAVWAAITDYAAIPGWWPAVKAVRTERRADGTEVTWFRDAHGNQTPYTTAESRPRERLVRVIATDRMIFGGKWTYELSDVPGGGTLLALTEDGWIDPPVVRAIARWFVGLDATQRDFIANLQKHLAAAPARP